MCAWIRLIIRYSDPESRQGPSLRSSGCGLVLERGGFCLRRIEKAAPDQYNTLCSSDFLSRYQCYILLIPVYNSTSAKQRLEDSRPRLPVGCYKKAPGDGAFSFRKKKGAWVQEQFQVKHSFGGSLSVCQSAKKKELFL